MPRLNYYLFTIHSFTIHYFLLLALLEVRSEMLDVRNYLVTFVQAFHFYGLEIEARGKMSILKSLRKAIKSNFLLLALLEVRSEMLDVRNYLVTFVQAFHFYGLEIEARGKMSILKSLRKAIKSNFLLLASKSLASSTLFPRVPFYQLSCRSIRRCLLYAPARWVCSVSLRP